jgi:hypothetical protein
VEVFVNMTMLKDIPIGAPPFERCHDSEKDFEVDGFKKNSVGKKISNC